MSEMQAGRELDALVAEKVMGFRVSWWSLHLIPDPKSPPTREWRHGPFSVGEFARGYGAEVLVVGDDGDMPTQEMFDGEKWLGILRYSTDMAAAWEVVDALVAKGFFISLDNHSEYWVCWFSREPDLVSDNTAEGDRTTDGAESPALAICLSALKAMERQR